jgi:hypothetical protein
MKRKQKPEIMCMLHGSQIPAGEYDAYARVADWYEDPQFKRWCCIVKFDVFDAGHNLLARDVPLWWNLGRGEKPKVGRRSKYFEAWTRASGEEPKRGDRLSPKVFVNRWARVRVGDSTGPKPKRGESLPKVVSTYSRIQEILDWLTGSVTTSTKSRNHLINEGSSEPVSKQVVTEKACQKENAPLGEVTRLIEASTLAGAEGQPQPKTPQRREVGNGFPQRQYTADTDGLQQFPGIDPNRREILKQQFAQLHTREESHV